MRRLHGGQGWALIVAVVIVWDAFAPETLSAAFERAAKEHPVPLATLWGTLTAHLFGVIPERYDPFTWALEGALRAFRGHNEG